MDHGFPYTPTTVQWYLTKRCNLTCSHCFNYEDGEQPRAAPNELSRDEALALMDRLGEAGVFHVNFLGGEVFTVPWFAELAARAVTHEVGVTVATNGTMVTVENATELWDAGVRQAQVSFDGTPEVHDAIRGKGAYARALRGMRILIEKGFLTRVAFTLMASNHHCLEPLLEMCVAERVPRFKLHGYIPAGRSSQELAEVPPLDVVRAAVVRLQRAERESDCDFRVEYPCYTGHLIEEDARKRWRVGDPARGLSCGAGTTDAVIWEDGSVGACEFFRGEQVGDLRSQSLGEIWRGGHEVIERWRRLELVGGKCGSCGYQADCGFGCRANAFYVGGDFYGGDPGCISAPPPGEVHPYDLIRDREPVRPRRVALPVLR